MEMLPEDWQTLCRINPLAQAQMEAITALRLVREKDQKIAELEAQLAQLNRHSQELTAPVLEE